MPLNGSDVASRVSGAAAVANTVAESAKYNSEFDDVYAILNSVRSIAKGYTGATTAIGAHDNFSTKGTDIASATTTDIGAATGRFVHITGTTTITGLGTKTAGVVRFVTFDGALTLTHNGTSLILPGAANITTAAGDTAIFVSEGSGNWRCLHYQRTSYAPPTITPWVAYTPTLAGFGTATSVAVRSRRVGSDLEVMGNFTCGTSTGSTATLSLGFNGVDGGLEIDDTIDSVRVPVGNVVVNYTGAAASYILAIGSAASVNFGIQSASRDGFTPVAGSALASSGNVISFKFSVPIEGW